MKTAALGRLGKQRLFLLSGFCICYAVFSVCPTFATAEPSIGPKIARELVYSYSFSQEYVVAGERVLTIDFTNTSQYDITALEFEFKLKTAFGDDLCDWQTYYDPSLVLPSGASANCTLKLTRHNFIGQELASPMEQADHVLVRYKRVLLNDGTVLQQWDLYEGLVPQYNSCRIDIQVISPAYKEGDPTEYHFSLIACDRESKSYDLVVARKASEHEDIMFDKLYDFAWVADFANIIGDKALVLRVDITNQSDKPVKKNWAPGDTIREMANMPVFTMVDAAGNQYNRHALAYTPKGWSNVAQGWQALLPRATLTLILVFDKPRDADVSELTVYIDNERYWWTLSLE